MVSSTAMKGPWKPSGGWCPGTPHVVHPVVLFSFSCKCSGLSHLCTTSVPPLLADLLLLSPMVQWRIFPFCYWICTLCLTQLRKLLYLSFIWDFCGRENPTTNKQWLVQSALLPPPPCWWRKDISLNRNRPAPSTCPGKYCPNTSSVMIPEQQSILTVAL